MVRVDPDITNIGDSLARYDFSSLLREQEGGATTYSLRIPEVS